MSASMSAAPAWRRQTVDPSRTTTSTGLTTAFTTRSLSLRSGQRELLDPVADLIAVQAEQGAGARLIATRAAQRLHDQAAFELLEVDAGCRQLEHVDAGRRHPERGKI